MKICLISKTVDPKTGGLGRHVKSLADSLVAQGHDVTVLTRKSPSSYETDADVVEVGFVNLFQDVLNSYSAMPGMLNYLRKRSEEFDIVHGHGLIGFSQTLAEWLNFSDTKFVYTLHGVSAEHTSRSWLKPFANLLFYPESLAVKSADGLIAVSKDTKEKAIDVYGLESSKLQVINNGVDLDKFSSGWSFNNKILFVGHFISRKGPDKLLEAFEILSRDFSELELVFVGSGRMEDELKEEVSSMGLEDCVLFKQGISDEELVELYGESVFCMPSLYEGFGMVYVEAMAAGAPVVATKGTAITEVIEDGWNGILTSSSPSEIKESLTRIVEEPELQEELSRNAKSTAENFSWDSIAGQTVEYYKETLE